MSKNRKIYGYWDCKYCGTKAIRGDNRNCPNCNHARDGDIKFYMLSENDYVEQENLHKFSEQPDWLCQYCNSYNPSNANACLSCGASKNSKKRDYIASSDELEKTDENDNINDNIVDKNEDGDVQARSTNTSLQILFYTILTGLAGLILFMFLLPFTPKNVDLAIDSFSWAREIIIEESYISSESDWNLPTGAELDCTKTEIRSYKQVVDHYETKTRTASRLVQDGYNVTYSYRDNGNGSFDQIEHKTPKYKTEYYQETYQDPVYRSEPVYDTKYYYQIKRWRECDRVKTSGSDRSPYFGDVDLAQGQRQGDKIERYYVHGYDTNDENHELSKYQTDYNIWTQLPNAGNTITLKITANNYITEIVSE